MRKAFLDSLAGKSLKEAKRLVKAEGHVAYVVPAGCLAITGEARPNTVVLWQDPPGTVHMASAGDTLELVWAT